MNRRGFFRSLAFLAGAASVSPNIFIPKFEPVRWKRVPPIIFKRAIPNPEYVKCLYEFRLIDQTGKWHFDIFDKPEPGVFYPLRFKVGDDGVVSQVPPFIVI